MSLTKVVLKYSEDKKQMQIVHEDLKKAINGIVDYLNSGGSSSGGSGAKGATGPVGPKGATGAKGPTGPYGIYVTGTTGKEKQILQMGGSSLPVWGPKLTISTTAPTGASELDIWICLPAN